VHRRRCRLPRRSPPHRCPRRRRRLRRRRSHRPSRPSRRPRWEGRGRRRARRSRTRRWESSKARRYPCSRRRCRWDRLQLRSRTPALPPTPMPLPAAPEAPPSSASTAATDEAASAEPAPASSLDRLPPSPPWPVFAAASPCSLVNRRSVTPDRSAHATTEAAMRATTFRPGAAILARIFANTHARTKRPCCRSGSRAVKSAPLPTWAYQQLQPSRLQTTPLPPALASANTAPQPIASSTRKRTQATASHRLTAARLPSMPHPQAAAWRPFAR